MNIREKVFNILSCGLSRDAEIEPLRKTLAINLIILAGSVSLISLSIVAFLKGYYILGVVDFALLLIMAGLHVLLRKTHNYQLLTCIGMILYALFLVYLLVFGGINNTSFVWAFTYPIMSLYLGGVKRGSVFSLSLLGVISAVFLLDSRVTIIASYDPDLKMRIIAAYITIYLFVLLIEKIREKVQSRLEQSNRALEKTVEELEKLNEDKSVLLKEVHHRVKNNFSIISSLLHLEAGRTENQGIKDVFLESCSRIKSMSMIHEQLYKSNDISNIDLSRYLKKLVNNLVQTYENRVADIIVEYELDELEVGIDKAIPCGLIVNELISNSLKYAFTTGRGQKDLLKIILQKKSGSVINLVVQDNGRGIPEEYNIETAETLGLKLVRIICKDQLKGSLKIDASQGTRVLIEFNNNDLKE